MQTTENATEDRSKKLKIVSKEKTSFLSNFSLAGFSQGYFSWIGKPIFRLYRGVGADLRAGDIRIHPEPYASIVGFFFIIATCVSMLGVPLLLVKTYVPDALVSLPYPLLFIFFSLPLLTLFLGRFYPKIKAINRASALEVEVPYASAYVSVMSTGGLSPYRSLQRLKNVELLPELSKAAKKMDLEVQILGVDPISAIESLARSTPSGDYRDLLLGYSSTLSAGGDVLHYLRTKAETLFRDRLTRVRAVGERMALLLEIYVAIAVLMALGVYLMFIVSRIMPPGVAMPTAFGSGQFIMFGYILFPLISIFFLYLADMFQPSYPSAEWRPYKAFILSIPLLIYLMLGMTFSFHMPQLRNNLLLAPLADFVVFVRSSLLGLELGFDTMIGLALTFIIFSIPTAITDYYYSKDARSVESGVTSFLRDLVEVRKTGMSPERAVMNLSKRDYGKLSPILKEMANRLGWGFTFEKIYKVFKDKVRSWLARINIYLLYEATEVGGGSPETLESLAHFSEAMESLEKEKRGILAPLLLVPYVGGLVLIAATLLLLSFTKSMVSISGSVVAYIPVVQLFTPPLIIHAFLSGLVAGKISGGRISNGFKHAIFLLLLSLVAAYLSPLLSVSLQM